MNGDCKGANSVSPTEFDVLELESRLAFRVHMQSPRFEPGALVARLDFEIASILAQAGDQDVQLDDLSAGS